MNSKESRSILKNIAPEPCMQGATCVQLHGQQVAEFFRHTLLHSYIPAKNGAAQQMMMSEVEPSFIALCLPICVQTSYWIQSLRM